MAKIIYCDNELNIDKNYSWDKYLHYWRELSFATEMSLPLSLTDDDDEIYLLILLTEKIDSINKVSIFNMLPSMVCLTDQYALVKYVKSPIECKYGQLIKNILQEGNYRIDRTGIGCISMFAPKLEYDISDNRIPLLTTKRMPWRIILKELLWFISGSTDVTVLQQQGIHIWDKNTSNEYLRQYNINLNENDIGPTYGFSYRHYGDTYKTCKDKYEGYDQLSEVIRLIRESPNSRRIFMCIWNPVVLNKVALPPCTISYQFYVNDNDLEILAYQRSGDMGLGVPFNIAQASILAHLIATITDKRATKLHYVLGDAHIYSNHVSQLQLQISRQPYAQPLLIINKKHNIDDYTYDDFKLIGYRYYPAIKMDMAI